VDVDAYLDVGEGRPGVVAKPADQIARVAVVVGVASVRRVEAQLAALIGRAHLLVHRVHRLEDPPCHLAELAQLDGLLHAVVLQVVGAGGRPESAGPRHGQAVHVRQGALPARVVEIGGPAREQRLVSNGAALRVCTKDVWQRGTDMMGGRGGEAAGRRGQTSALNLCRPIFCRERVPSGERKTFIAPTKLN